MADEQDIPIRGLAELESPVSRTFLQYIRRKIYRRTATAQFTNFSISMPMAILVEFLSIMVHLLKVVDGRKGRTR